MKIILEIDGVRHRQAADDPNTSAYCVEDRCSLYQFCQESSVCPCCINDLGGRYFHYEKEVQDEAKKPNEIREEVRKQTAAKYKEEIERLKKLASDRWDNYMDATKRLADLHDENEQLKEKLAAQKDWIERLMQFMDMPDEQRSKAVKEYVENKRMSEEFRELFSPYFETLNRLNILSW